MKDSRNWRDSFPPAYEQFPRRLPALDFWVRMGVRTEKITIIRESGNVSVAFDEDSLDPGERAHVSHFVMSCLLSSSPIGRRCCGCGWPFTTWARAQYATTQGIPPGHAHAHLWCHVCWNQEHPEQHVPADPQRDAWPGYPPVREGDTETESDTDYLDGL